MNKETGYTWIGALTGGIVGLLVSVMLGGGEILGTLMFRGMEALRLSPYAIIAIVIAITIVAGAIVGRIIIKVAGYPNAKAIIGAIIAGSVAGMVLVSATVESWRAIIGTIFGAIGGGIFSAIAGTRKDTILRTIIGGVIASTVMLGGAILGISGNEGSYLIAGAIVGGAVGGAIGGIIVSSIVCGVISGAFGGVIFVFAIVGDAMAACIIFACAVFGAIFGATAGLRESVWKKKYIIIIILFFIYVVATILGSLSMGVISVHTDKKEYSLGEKVTVSSRNSGITLLCGVPYWNVYKINDSNETLVYGNEVRGPQCRWPGGYFGVEGMPVVWNPSEVYAYTDLKVGPQKEGKYKIVVAVRTGGSGFNTSDSMIITVK
ncbi:Uncharacterised protein [uncultured archaeon]|nr:Uncharacterised protein [uncultured archaeon]